MIEKLTMPIARKNHYCSLCKRLIPKGDKYARKETYDDDGRYEISCGSIKEHTNCELYKHMPHKDLPHREGETWTPSKA